MLCNALNGLNSENFITLSTNPTNYDRKNEQQEKQK